jgi:hypothetical protein
MSKTALLIRTLVRIAFFCLLLAPFGIAGQAIENIGKPWYLIGLTVKAIGALIALIYLIVLSIRSNWIDID